jgi:hypothetical protein
MGHGWGLHGGTWKMGTWGRNITPETLHVFRAQVTWASKCVLGRLLKCDMFRWVVGFEVQVLRLMFHGV